MRLPLTRWTRGLLALGVLGVPSVWAARGGDMFSPGALHDTVGAAIVRGGVRSHAELAGDCGACHVPIWRGGRMADACLRCHDNVSGELATASGLHGSVQDGEACLACHTEHRGAVASLTRGTLLAGEHERFGFSLAGHERTSVGEPFACADCHASDTFTFDTARCEGCHREDAPEFTADHVRQWGTDCLACHDGRSGDGAGFDHAATGFPLEGAHAGAACTACHAPDPAGPGATATPTECVSCHGDDDVHGGDFSDACGQCHGTVTWKDVDFDHRFPLDHGRRGPSECVVCHQDAPTSYATYTCYSCHEHSPERIAREHRGERIGDYSDCVRCHATGREHESRGRRRESERRERSREHEGV